MATRRPLLSVLSLLLAFLTLAGMTLPTPGLWQCRHASRLVAALPSAPPNAMPCRMAGMPLSAMPCCRKMAHGLPSPSESRPSLRPAPCRPTLSPMALLSPASLADGPGLRQSASADAAPLPFTPGLRFAPALSVSLPRPPPACLLPGPPLRSPSLRAPPVA